MLARRDPQRRDRAGRVDLTAQELQLAALEHAQGVEHRDAVGDQLEQFSAGFDARFVVDGALWVRVMDADTQANAVHQVPRGEVG